MKRRKFETIGTIFSNDIIDKTFLGALSLNFGLTRYLQEY